MPYLTVSVSCCRKLCHWMGPETYVAMLYKDDMRTQPGIQRRKYLELRGSLQLRPKSKTTTAEQNTYPVSGLGKPTAVCKWDMAQGTRQDGIATRNTRKHRSCVPALSAYGA
jgi:hypothetical protein